MKKPTSLKLSKQLARYGALATAIVGIGVADANGQSIIYTDFDDFSGTVGDGNEFLIDLDSDGTVDFIIKDFFNVPSLFIFPQTASNDVLGSGGIGLFPYALTSGAIISSGVATWNNDGFNYGADYQALNVGFCSQGNWCSVTDRYLGLRFNISGATHYGWVRMDVIVGDGWVFFDAKDMAYHDTAGFPINAGQKTLSLDSNVLDKIKIVSLNKSIGLYNLPEAINYKLFSITGKQVLEGTTFGHSFVVEANSVSNGIYIIELTEVNSKAVIRKKLVL